MSDIRFEGWLHRSGTGGVYQDSAGNVGIASTQPQTRLDIGNGGFQVGPAGICTVTTVKSTNVVNATPLSHRNLLINSEFVVNQRANSSVAVGDGNYPCDRWKIANNGTLTGTMEVSTQVPTIDSNNFTKSIKVTSTSTTAASSAGDYAAIGQRLERNAAANFGWGTSNAQSLTLSFYVRSSKTGIFSAYLIGGDGFNRTFTFEYTIASANTWQKVEQTITGDTGGSWTYSTDNSIGLGLNFVLENLGSGAGTTSSLNSWQAGNNYAGSTNQVNLFDTNGATWYVAGVQLERGSVATQFEHRKESDELAQCHRYYQKIHGSSLSYFGVGNVDGATMAQILVNFITEMRVAPTSLETNGTGSHYSVRMNSNATGSSVPTLSNAHTKNAMVIFYAASHGFTNGQAVFGRSANSTAFLAFSAEL